MIVTEHPGNVAGIAMGTSEAAGFADARAESGKATAAARPSGYFS